MTCDVAIVFKSFAVGVIIWVVITSIATKLRISIVQTTPFTNFTSVMDATCVPTFLAVTVSSLRVIFDL